MKGRPLRVEPNWFDAQHVFPIGLVQQYLAQLVPGCLPREEQIECLPRELQDRDRVDEHSTGK